MAEAALIRVAGLTPSDLTPPGPRLVRALFLGGCVAVLLYAAWMSHRIQRDPALAFLQEHAGAAWVRHDEAPVLETRAMAPVAHFFRTRLTVPDKLAAPVLEVRGMTRVQVFLDGRQLPPGTGAPSTWKEALLIRVDPGLAPGPHALTVRVENSAGPPALWVRSEALGVATDTQWESSVDARSWRPVRLATDRPAAAVSKEVEPPLNAVASRAALFSLIFCTVCGLTLLAGRTRWAHLSDRGSRMVRVTALGAWALLAVHNLPRIPLPAGFDLLGHLDYINFVSRHGALPLATDGWQMFQSPLYYVCSAALLRGAAGLVEPNHVLLLLRIIPLACGLAQIELAHRALRRVWPDRPDLQAYGTLFAALLPMNLYLSHYLGNEPMAATLGAAAFTLALRLLRPRPGEDNRWTPLGLGAVLGLALLTKVSAALMSLPVLLAVALAGAPGQPAGWAGWRRALGRSAVVLGMATLVAGWYYVRNLVRLGRPFIGGWDPAGGSAWWQEPGFRMTVDFTTFGASLQQPTAVSLRGFWDGFYATLWSDSMLSGATTLASAPPWRHGMLAAAVLLAVLPTLTLMLGGTAALRAVWRAHSALWLVVLSAIAVYGLALLHHALTVPYYCAIKAFYTLGAMPAYVLLLAAGAEWVVRRPVGRAVAHGAFACWGVAIYSGFLATN